MRPTANLNASRDSVFARRASCERRYLEALCRLAGLDFHADRVRQSSHVRVVEEEAPEEGEETEPDREPVTEAPPEDVAEESEPEGEEVTVINWGWASLGEMSYAAGLRVGRFSCGGLKAGGIVNLTVDSTSLGARAPHSDFSKRVSPAARPWTIESEEDDR